MVQGQSLEAFLDEVGCPFEAGSDESVTWVRGYMSGVSRCRQLADGEVRVELTDDELGLRFVRCEPA